MLRQKESGIFCVGNGHGRVVANHIAAAESLFGLPDVAAGIRERLGGSGLDPNDALHGRHRRHCWGLNCRRGRRGGLRRGRRGLRRALIVRLATGHESEHAGSCADTDSLSKYVSHNLDLVWFVVSYVAWFVVSCV